MKKQFKPEICIIPSLCIFQIEKSIFENINHKMKQTANVIGATGLVGVQLVKQLLDNDTFEKVRIFVRRDSGVIHPKLEQQIIDFNDSKSWLHLLEGDILFSTLGTTLKQAGSQEKQYAIDFTLNYNFAKAAKDNGIPNYVLISSMSANSNAKVFYSRMKGELDDAVSALNYEYLSILRPGPLAGNRKERRLGEIIGLPIIGFITKLIGKRYRPIYDSTVARAMINTALSPQKDKTIWEGEELFALANTK